MDQREIEVINTVGSKSFDEKKAFLKAYFDALNPEEAKWVRNIAQRYKRKGDRAGTVQRPQHRVQPIPDPNEPPQKANKIEQLIPKPWWVEYDRSEIFSLDCEFVMIPRERGFGEKQRYDNEAGVVAICDFFGNPVYKAKVKRPRGTYHVTQKSIEINGIRPGDLERSDCVDFNMIYAEVEEILRGKLVIGHGVAADFRALKMEPGEFDTFDLQWEWWREESGQRLEFRLKALYLHFFSSSFQDGTHDPMADCQAAMRIFREKYIAGEKMSPANLRYNLDPVPPGMINPLRQDKTKFKKR